MAFRRKVYDELLRWKQRDNGKTAVLLEGAKRVGKTTVVTEFAKNEYRSHILIDFSEPSDDIVEIFENCDKESQMLVVDCNPSLLRDGLLRRDAIWFAQKDSESSTEYFSLSDFKGARSRIPTSQRYMQGAFGSLPILSEFYFVHDGTPVQASANEEVSE